MPSFFSHHYMCHKALDALPADVAAPLRANIGFCELGAQGPDPFFYFTLSPTERKLIGVGVLMQNTDVARTMELLIKGACGDSRYEAYFFGYLCHYALDCAAHPYIMAMTCDACHTPFENQLESSLAAYAGLDPAKVAPGDSLPKKRIEKQLDPLWQPIFERLAAAFGQPRLFSRAVAAERRGLALLDGRGAFKPWLFSVLENKRGALTGLLYRGKNYPDIDYLNLQKQPWKPVWDDVCRRDSFPEMLEQSTEAAVKMYLAALDAWRTEDYSAALACIGGRDYGTAIEGEQPKNLEPELCVFGERCLSGRSGIKMTEKVEK